MGGLHDMPLLLVGISVEEWQSMRIGNANSISTIDPLSIPRSRSYDNDGKPVACMVFIIDNPNAVASEVQHPPLGQVE